MKMEIKSVILSALLFPAIASATVFHGIYGSVNLGMTQSYEKLQHDIDLVFPSGSPVLLDISVYNNPPLHVSHISPQGGLSLGYAWMMNRCLSLGVEARAAIQHLDMNHVETIDITIINIDSSFQSRVKMDSSYALLAKLGWVLTPRSQIYGLAGPDWGIFSFSGNGKGRALPGRGTVSNANFNEQQSIHKWGYLLGLGFELGVTENGSAALEYNFAHYGSLNVPQLQEDALTSAPVGSNIHAQNSVKILTNSVMLRYSYYFHC